MLDVSFAVIVRIRKSGEQTPVTITIIKRANNETELQSLLLTSPFQVEQLNNHEIEEMELKLHKTQIHTLSLLWPRAT